MKKVLFMALALVSAMMFTACDPDTKTPDGDKTKLWPAGVDGENLYGYINKSGEMVIKANFKDANYFSCGWALVLDEDGEYAYIDKDGKKARGAEADYYRPFYYDRARFGEKGSNGTLYGMWDTDFQAIIPADYKSLGNNSNDGLIYFSEDAKKYGYLDEKGKVVIPDDFDYAYSFDDGIAVVVEVNSSDEARYGVIDTKGNELIEMQKKSLYNLGEARVSFYNDSKNKYGIWDKKGEEIVSATYDNIDPFTCGLALVEKNDKWGYIDTKGNEVIDLQYAGAMQFYDDVAWVQKNADSKVELIDKKGNSLFKLKDTEQPYGYFHNGLCEIYNSDSHKYYYINKDNEKVYTWDPTASDKDDMPARKSLRELSNEWIKATEYGPLFIDMEQCKAQIAR